jgi:tRNA pseudouridine38-40 synthase
MARYQVKLSYDGTLYRGFQRLRAQESNTNRSIQGTVEAALRSLNWQGRAIMAAGRTDAGVHAQGQVIAFDLEWRHSVKDLRNALNARLPEDIAADEVHETQDDFHPRYAAKARWYSYRLFCDEVRHPLDERFAWRVWPPITAARMIEAAGYLAGRHDFAAFGASPRAGGSTVRMVYQSEWREWQGFWVYDIVANSYLLHMVRRIVKLLVEIGQGLKSPKSVLEYLDGGKPIHSQGEQISMGNSAEDSERGIQPMIGLAPPHGLHLFKVFYIPFGKNYEVGDRR